MKTFLILIVSLSFTIAAIAQVDSVRHNDSIGQGFTIKAEAKNEYKDSLKEGKWVEYTSMEHDDGKLHHYYTLTLYKAGKPDGIVREYTSKEKLYIETPYVNGVKNGVEKYYFGKKWVNIVMPYKNGRLHGVVTYYNQDGKIYAEEPYVNGRELGVAKWYYPDGKISSEEIYNEDGSEMVKYFNKEGEEISEKNGWKGFYDKNGKEIK